MNAGTTIDGCLCLPNACRQGVSFVCSEDSEGVFTGFVVRLGLGVGCFVSRFILVLFLPRSLSLFASTRLIAVAIDMPLAAAVATLKRGVLAGFVSVSRKRMVAAFRLLLLLLAFAVVVLLDKKNNKIVGFQWSFVQPCRTTDC